VQLQRGQNHPAHAATHEASARAAPRGWSIVRVKGVIHPTVSLGVSVQARAGLATTVSNA